YVWTDIRSPGCESLCFNLQMKIQEIKRSAELSRKSANRHTADSVQVFGALVQLVQRSLENLIEAIEEKQKTTQKQAEGYIQELEQEISELTKRSTEVERLSHIEDCSRDAIPPTKNWTEVNIPPPPYGRSLGSVVTQLKEKFINGTEKLIAKAKLIRVQEYAVDVSLDPDTANAHLLLSDNGKQVFCGDNLPDSPKRFDRCVNVLGKEGFSSGRFYFEVQVKGKTDWTVGVAKESVDRKGKITLSPEDGFWTVWLRNGDEYTANDAPSVDLSLKMPLQKVGVFVNYEDGLVCFYDAETADLLYAFTDCSFTEKLYPYFSPCSNDNGRNSAPLIICPVNCNN
uniref:B30.2/SPRY domain-containing protein n=1 Tax=Seriola lalandi dorsalis TaxID=1841481 RepID=A0A3B4YGB1_SERLL